MRVQVVASLENLSAGPTYTVSRLAESIASHGHSSIVMCTGRVVETPLQQSGVVTFPQFGIDVPAVRKLYFSRQLYRALKRAASEGALLHSHGLWTLPNLYAAYAADQFRVVHVISPRGMLSPGALQFSRYRKSMMWNLAQGKLFKQARCLHATSRQELEELRNLGIQQPIAVVPNGIDLPSLEQVDVQKKLRSPERQTLLYLGRIHPKKGIDHLLEAWKRLEGDFLNWDLVIVGPSEVGHKEELQRRAVEVNLKRVIFKDPVHSVHRDKLYQGADLFVLPTLSENFGMVVAEALSNCTPVICTNGAPWSRLNSTRAGWWIEPGIASIEMSLRNAMSMSRDALDSRGRIGRFWMMEEFSWDRVATDMEAVYRWSRGIGERPPFLEAGK